MASNKHNTSLKVFKQLQKLIAPKPDTTYFVNRNPRNLELMKIGYKPDGYHLDKPGKCFWHKWVQSSHTNIMWRLRIPFYFSCDFDWFDDCCSRLVLNKTQQGIVAQIVHFQNGVIVQASTGEWAIKKHLYRTTDTSAHINLARVGFRGFQYTKTNPFGQCIDMWILNFVYSRCWRNVA